MQKNRRTVDPTTVTLPRPVHPGDTVMAQKRCIHGQFRLRPDWEVVQAYLYCLAYYADKYGIRLHEFVTMSNHDHVLFTDPNGVRPLFIQQAHALFARAINARFGDADCFWSGQRHSAPVLGDPQKVAEECLYVLLNPVEAGLVRYAWDWEGATSWGLEYGKPLKIKRPDFFFSEDMPEEVELVIYRPDDLYPELSDREARARLRRDAKVEQGRMISKARAEGKTFMGMRRVLRQPRRNRPRNFEPIGGIRPHFATSSRWQRVEMARDLKRFWAEHETARLAFERGERDVAFPRPPVSDTINPTTLGPVFRFSPVAKPASSAGKPAATKPAASAAKPAATSQPTARSSAPETAAALSPHTSRSGTAPGKSARV